ncbi:SH3 domain-containing protein [Streptomyces shenzhenensis]|uniref:SH3 domain-containing protein n=1 Tax=Streptomyces shenzhenensis TaxID=943815 RepID=UPI0034035AB1
MTLRSVLARGVAMAAASGALVGLFSSAPAAATPRGGEDDGRYQGVVTAASGLWLHDRPDRGSNRIGFARHGEIVSISCTVYGDNVNGNPLWYLLADGSWAWASARYIDNIGPAPRWC